MPELLAPAGDMESLDAALYFGADAVYVGGELLQLRAKRAEFTRQELIKAVDKAHSAGKKLYVTVNSFAKNGEIPLCAEYAHFLANAGADAAIVSDLGVLSEFAKAEPDLELHISTQANCTNYATAMVYYNMGAKRIVLARENTLEDLAFMRSELPETLKLEVFVHGAMCMAYSGRCLLSSYLTARSGNRGECSQPCRWNYALTEEKRPGEYYPIDESGGMTTILSSHDLCSIAFLDKLESAGAASFKIEGRMKTAYYVATAVNAYRMAMDKKASVSECMDELNSLKHRPYSTGFYFGETKTNPYNDGKYSQTRIFVGNVLGWENGLLKIRQRNHFKVGDTIEVLSPKERGRAFTVGSIITEDGTVRDCAPHPGEILFVPCPFPLSPGDFLRKPI